MLSRVCSNVRVWHGSLWAVSGGEACRQHGVESCCSLNACTGFLEGARFFRSLQWLSRSKHPRFIWKSKIWLPCLQKDTTEFYLQPDEPSLYYNYLRFILILFSHLLLVLGSFLWHFFDQNFICVFHIPREFCMSCMIGDSSNILEPVTVAARSWAAFVRFDAGIVGSNPT
jgi:hypothetical protein